MENSKLSYLGPIPRLTPATSRMRWLRRVPVGFLIIVALPTLISFIYFLMIASPRYVSEARFVVRAPAKEQPSNLGVALAGVGLSAQASDSFAVHEYLTSRDSLRDIGAALDLRRMYSRAGVDAFSRLPLPLSDSSFETFHKQFNGYVTVGYNSGSGISTLRVEAFTPEDAQRVNNALLQSAETLVNRLNSRSSAAAVVEARTNLEEAQARLTQAQQNLTSFRNRERFIDPARTAQAGSELIGELAIQVATLRAERAQIAADAPNSPQLPFLDSRIRAFEAQIQQEQRKIVGDADSLAPKLSVYEQLELERTLADKLLASATASLDNAQMEARRQRLYLDRIVAPNLPDEATEPARWRSILSVLASCLLAYGIGWLVWAGIRESRTDL